MNESFQEWWNKLDVSGLSSEYIAKLAWNEALRLACEDFKYQEGTDYGVGKDLQVSL